MSADNQVIVFERPDGRFAVKHVVSFYPPMFPIAETDAETEHAPSFLELPYAIHYANRLCSQYDYVEYGIGIYRRADWDKP